MKQTPKLRRSGIGGSDMPAILGLIQSRSAVDVYLEKLGRAPGFAGNERTELGNLLEPVIARIYTKRTGHKLEKMETLRHPEHSFIMANIDRRIKGQDKGVECKLVGAEMFLYSGKWGDAGTDEIPMEYMIQAQHYMLVTGWTEFDVAALFGTEFRIFTIKRDEDIIRHILQSAIAFWICVQTQTPPAAVSVDDMRLLYPKDNGLSVVADDETRELVQRLHSTVAEISLREEIKELLEIQIQDKMREATILRGPEGEELCTWKEQTSERFDIARHAKEHPETHAEYMKEIKTRVFRRKKVKQ